ncbi:related to Heat shock protein SSC1, mitochondrial [Hanseniaspora guilliermondii]|uniref:Related to Heat shock protein SSC1, mitochondrial n=1 Tax=Hanseniaspora guilliermondii TaxID=56406 RepID=A0A1L0FPC4_9ASCO|nr:related to Heat shock protein SSC1, mitochondrial [Hanseniaspora guilliermondii]
MLFNRLINKRYNSLNTKKIVLGIDLGTTNSLASHIPKSLDNTQTPIILNTTKTPSIVGFAKKGNDLSDIPSPSDDKHIFELLKTNLNVFIGEKAQNQYRLNPENTFKAMKRIIGTFNDNDEIFESYKNQYSNNVAINNSIYFNLFNSNLKVNAEIIAGFILSDIKSKALKEIGVENGAVDAVITVPAYFNNLQRKATLNAANLANINCLRIINEPTAAALSFGVMKQNNDGVYAVYDLGGGTFDISILELDGAVFEVRGTAGDLKLGGEDLDYLIRDYALDKFLSNNNNINREDVLKNNSFMNELLNHCEKLKIELSTTSSSQINIPFAFKNVLGDFVHFKVEVQESEIDKLAEPLVKKTIKIFKKCLKDANIDKQSLQQILLVGGMTRMPYIRKQIIKNFISEDNSENDTDNKLNFKINPDDSVCLGASIQAGLLTGEIKDVLLLDVNPLTLGMETYGGLMSPMLKKNCNVPIEYKEQFTTGIDNQQIVKINIYQGESKLCRDNVKLGEFVLSGIPQLPKGVPKIEVSFKLDSNGILNVTAKELLTNLECNLELITTAPIENNSKQSSSNVDSNDLAWVFENLGLWQLSFKELDLMYRKYADSIHFSETISNEFNELKSKFDQWNIMKNDSSKDAEMVDYFVKKGGMNVLKNRINKLQTDLMSELKGKKV